MPMLEVQDLTVRYGPLEAVRGISFTVEQGQIVALVGSNGAGKSSTLKALIGLAPAASGRIAFEGRDIARLGSAARVSAGLALSPEGRRLFGRMTVLDNLMAGAHGVRPGSRVRARLDEIYTLFPRVQERRAQLAGSLSGGEQQMVAIARGMMADPKLLVFDEPSLGLSPLLVQQMFDIIRDVTSHGVTVLLVEQNVFRTLRLADRGYVLENGAIVRTGTGAELLADPHVKKAYLGH